MKVKQLLNTVITDKKYKAVLTTLVMLTTLACVDGQRVTSLFNLQSYIISNLSLKTFASLVQQKMFGT